MMLRFCNRYKNKNKKTFSPGPCSLLVFLCPATYPIYYETLGCLNVEKSHVHFEGEGGGAGVGEEKESDGSDRALSNEHLLGEDSV